MKKTNILYWTFTGLFAAFMIMSGFPDILSHPEAVKYINQELGYPLYFIPFIGAVKVLGAIAILVPGFPRIKEWAYAGFAFDLIGATYSIAAVGKTEWALNFIPLAFLAIAYFLYHKRRKMQEQRNAFTQRNGDRLVTGAMA